jgi:hypothetical protein
LINIGLMGFKICFVTSYVTKKEAPSDTSLH